MNVINLRALPHALSAPEWEALGKEWNPIVQCTGLLSQEDEVEFVNWLLERFGKDVVAYFYCVGQVFGADDFFLELQFQDDKIGSECLRLARKGPWVMKKPELWVLKKDRRTKVK